METTERHFVFHLREGPVKSSLPIELTEDNSENARELLELVIRQTRTAAKQVPSRSKVDPELPIANELGRRSQFTFDNWHL
jgi:hypothetical protein